MSTCITCQGLLAAAGALHDPLPFVLPDSSRTRLWILDERTRSADVRLGQRLQSIRSVYQRDERMNVAALRPFYEELIAEYFPAKIDW